MENKVYIFEIEDYRGGNEYCLYNNMGDLISAFKEEWFHGTTYLGIYIATVNQKNGWIFLEETNALYECFEQIDIPALHWGKISEKKQMAVGKIWNAFEKRMEKYNNVGHPNDVDKYYGCQSCGVIYNNKLEYERCKDHCHFWFKVLNCG